MLMPDGAVVRINLGMSGRFVIGKQHPKHTRWGILVKPFALGPLRAVRFVDPRTFGRISVERGEVAKELASPRALMHGSKLAGLGPDLLTPFMLNGDPVRRMHVWRAALDTPTPVKFALMEQHRLAGLGNIYASELCSAARLNPFRPANSLTRTELLRLASECAKMMPLAVRNGGTSFGDANTFRDSQGHEGSYSRFLRVYGRAGERCKCESKIKVSREEGRATYWCSSCQK
jgi:formamidopyrimidine-DNA glycosylase